MNDKPHTPDSGGSSHPIVPVHVAKPTRSRATDRKNLAAFVRRHKIASMVGAFLAVALLMSLVMKFVGGGKKEKPTAAAGAGTVAVNVLEVKPDRFQDNMVVVGNIKGGSEITLRFEVDGVVDLFEFRQGDKIRKGDIIAQLNQRDARLKLKKARLELDQMEKLYAMGGVSLNKLEEARVAAEMAASELEKTVLRSPRDGVLGDKDAEVGEFVTPSKKVATLVNIESVMVSIGVIEKEIDRVFPGQKVVLTVDTYPGVDFTGKVENINPLVTGSRTMNVEARLENEGGLLLPGMFARAKITVFEQDNALFLPNDALEKTPTGQRVYVVTKDNKAEARDVEVGYVSSQFSLINKGLEVGELVVTQKPQELKAGSSVKIIETQK